MRFVLAALALLWVGTSTSAATIVYACELQRHGLAGWTPREATYGIDTSKQQIIAMDPYIFHANKKSLNVTVTEFGPRVYRFKYTLLLPSRESGKIQARYSVRLDTKTNRVVVAAYVENNPRHRGTGKCRILKK